jgi:galactokinase
MLMEHIKPFHARDRAINLYADEFDSGPTRLVRSPGRINIIGDHVDYEGGLVLPLTLHGRPTSFCHRSTSPAERCSEPSSSL